MGTPPPWLPLVLSLALLSASPLVLAQQLPAATQQPAASAPPAAGPQQQQYGGQNATEAAARGFVIRQGTQLLLDGSPFYFVGGNAYWFIDFYGKDWQRVRIEETLDAAQRLGLTVIRTWAFNDGLPKRRFTYDTRQLAGMDWMVYAAKRRGIHLLMTLGNLWRAYKGPEEFLAQATGTAAGKDVLDFYADPHARALFKLHIWVLVSRVNPYTGLAYRDEPAIFGWSLFNEPRCPGCMQPDQQAVHQSWMSEMASFLRRIDPLHLITPATEGFFVQDDTTNYHLLNPGAGTQCDGEDWLAISAMQQFDVTTAHIYERHLELRPEPTSAHRDWPNWVFCGFECYIEWFRVYMDAHVRLSADSIGKPLILEEFGSTWWKATKEDQRVLFKLVFDWVAQQQRDGGPFVGALFWNAAHNDTGDVDGYNIFIDRPGLTQKASALSPPPPAWLAPPMIAPDAAAAGIAAATRRELLAGEDPAVVGPLPPDDTFFPPEVLPAHLSDLAAALAKLPPLPPAAVAVGVAPGGGAVIAPAVPVAAPAAAAVVALAPRGTAPNATVASVGPGTLALKPAAAAAAPTAPPVAAAPPLPGAVAAAAAVTPAAGSPPRLPTLAASTNTTTAILPGAAVAQPTAAPAVATPLTAVAPTPLLPAAVSPPAPRTPATITGAAPAQPVGPPQVASTSAPVPLNATTPPAAVPSTPATAPLPAAAPAAAATTSAPPPPPQSPRTTTPGLLPVMFSAGDVGAGLPAAPLAAAPQGRRRRGLLVVEDELDDFRRAGWRSACAKQAAKTWRPYRLFNLTNVVGSDAALQAARGVEVVSLISAATAGLRAGTAAAPRAAAVSADLGAP